MKATIMITIDTTTLTRETYVAFRPQWRADYKALSAEIRALKIDTKDWQKLGRDASGRQSRLHALAIDATAALKNLAEAKARLKEIASEVARAA
jgi:hypothetical protein